MVLRIDGDDLTLVLSSGDGILCFDYFGPRLPAAADVSRIALLSGPVVPHGRLDGPARTEAYPSQDGIPRLLPALAVTRAERPLDVELRIADTNVNAREFRAELVDPAAGVRLTYQATFLQGDVLAIDIHLRNDDARPLGVQWLASGHVPLPSHLSRVLTHGGFWANEFQPRESYVSDHLQSWETAAGRSSHGSSASLVAMEPGTRNEAGEALQIALVWPGNHRLALAPVPGGQAAEAGVRLEGGELVLQEDGCFSAPRLLITYSDSGLNGLRQRTQAFWSTLRNDRSRRPVHFNTWEACYFDHTEATVRELITQAQDLGAERFVLDDGWMAGRNAAGVGLGDWQACPQRYPQGLAPIADAARAAGMEFGLWIEPEMVTEDSELARAHPDWIVRRTNRTPISGRRQYLLNIGLPAVRAYLADTLDRLIAETGATYLKWDMNRDYAEVGAASDTRAIALTEAWQTLVADFRTRHPRVTLEICGAGGARSDAGTMRLADRLWPSDSLDPLQRLRVLEQASLLLPHDRLGWHIGSARSETSGAVTSLHTRCLMACLGHLGLEVNPAALSADECDVIRHWTSWFKTERSWLQQATLRFLDVPDAGISAVLLTDREAATGRLFLLRVAYPTTGDAPCLRLRYLDPNTTYRITRHVAPEGSFAQHLAPWQAQAKSRCDGVLLNLIGLRLPPLLYGQAELIALDRIDRPGAI